MRLRRSSKQSTDNNRLAVGEQALMEFAEALAVLAARRDHALAKKVRRPRKRVLKEVNSTERENGPQRSDKRKIKGRFD